MSHRIEVELTSTREDGTWTWRAAGARQPKGVLEGSLLPADAKIGNVLRVEADFDVDGILVTAVLPSKGARPEPQLLEVLGTRRDDEPLVTQTLAPKGRGGDRRRGDDKRRGKRREGSSGEDAGKRRERDRVRDRDRDRGPRSERDPGEAAGAERRRERTRKPRPPKADPKPKAKRLRPGRTHRNEVLAELPDEHKVIAEQVLRGGIPGVRQAIEKQNEENQAQGRPLVDPAALESLAEKLLPGLRTAEWRDRADAALADLDELDLRDLRSVVNAADAAARDDETRQLAEQLRVGLTTRLEREQATWLAEIAKALEDGRAVGALRLSSRPPKAGSPIPTDLAERLATAASESLTSDTTSDRFAIVLDALAYSPVRTKVKAIGMPAEPSDELRAAVAKLASRLPQIAEQFAPAAPAAPPAPSTPPAPSSASDTGTPEAATQGTASPGTPTPDVDTPESANLDVVDVTAAPAAPVTPETPSASS